MEWHIGDGVAELFTLGMALAILIVGWQLFRAVVALAMGALTGAAHRPSDAGGPSRPLASAHRHLLRHGSQRRALQAR